MANIYRYVNGSFKLVTGQLATIAVGETDEVWGINDAGKAWRFNSSKGKFEGKTASVAFKHIAVGSGVWAIDVTGSPHRWDGVKFVKVGGKTTYIGVPLRSGNPWARYGASITRYDPKAKSFLGVSNGNNFKFLGVGNDDSRVWGIDNDGMAWMWNGTTFVQNANEALRFTAVAPGLNSVYGISLSGRIYKTKLLTDSKPPYFEDGLISTSGRLKRIDTGAVDVSGYGQSAEIDCAWGMNAAGKVYEYYEGNWKLRGGPYSVLAVGVGTLKQGLAGDGKTTVWNQEPNVWALG